jgi:hypothetical protein
LPASYRWIPVNYAWHAAITSYNQISLLFLKPLQTQKSGYSSITQSKMYKTFISDGIEILPNVTWFVMRLCPSQITEMSSFRSVQFELTK